MLLTGMACWVLRPLPFPLGDVKLAQATLNGLMVPRPPPTAHNPQGLCLDKGYDYGAVYLTP